jgi:hypothetical protein
MEKKTKKPAVSNYQPEYTAIKKIEEPENLKTPRETSLVEQKSDLFSGWTLPPQRTSYIKAREHDCF